MRLASVIKVEHQLITKMLVKRHRSSFQLFRPGGVVAITKQDVRRDPHALQEQEGRMPEKDRIKNSNSRPVQKKLQIWYPNFTILL